MKQVVTFGEIMLRLKSPGQERFFQSPKFEATFGGSEANVAVCLNNFGVETSFVTVVPNNNIGNSCINEVRRYGVDTTEIIQKDGRLGVYFLESGTNQRASNVIYDRKDSLFSIAKPGDFDWDSIFNNAEYFYISGIAPAVSRSSAQLSLEAVKSAKRLGLTVCCDLNYRSKLWKYGESIVDVMTELFKYVDVGIANGEACEKCLGIKSGGNTMSFDSYENLSQLVIKEFPQLTVLAFTARESANADCNTISAFLRFENRFYISKPYTITNIVDRVGGGDAFTAGLIYGLINYGDDYQKILDFSIASDCLKHTVTGDFNLVSVGDVEKLLLGDVSGRVQR